MKRRNFLKAASAGAIGAAALAAPVVHAAAEKKIRWRMATSWPTNLGTLWGGARDFAERVKELTGGNFDIRPYAAGELVGGLQVLDSVQTGTVECGISASYYFTGKEITLAIDTALPFGMTTRMQSAWMYYGGGSELMNKEVFSNFNIVSFPVGNTNAQMAGWFRKEVPDLASLKGLKMRIPGMGGEVMAQLGVNVQTLAAAEVFPALERGVIDATEFVGPYDDEKLGFWQVAKNYYHPAWWEPCGMISVYINQKEYAKLPKEYQHALQIAAADCHIKMIARYDYLNPIAVKKLVERGVVLRKFSDEIMKAAQEVAFDIYNDLEKTNKTWAAVYKPWKQFRDSQYAWHSLTEQGFADFASSQADLSKIGAETGMKYR